MDLKLDKDITETIMNGVKSVFTSENYKKYLNFLSRFHNYSFNNQILIFCQCEEATYVAGYKTWEKMNRYVKKGQKGIKILAPYKKKFKKNVSVRDEYGECCYDVQGNKLFEEKEYTVTKYKPVTVFDISQTEGEDVPQLVQPLKGTSETIRNLIYAVTSIAESSVIFKTKDEDRLLKSGARGYYDLKKDVIVIDENLEDLQKLKTLIHEYAHSILHNCDTEKDRNIKEIEAESIAYMICSAFGLDTSSYSFPYIFGYSKNDVNNLLTTLNNIRHISSDILGRIGTLIKT